MKDRWKKWMPSIEGCPSEINDVVHADENNAGDQVEPEFIKAAGCGGYVSWSEWDPEDVLYNVARRTTVMSLSLSGSEVPERRGTNGMRDSELIVPHTSGLGPQDTVLVEQRVMKTLRTIVPESQESIEYKLECHIQWNPGDSDIESGNQCWMTRSMSAMCKTSLRLSDHPRHPGNALSCHVVGSWTSSKSDPLEDREMRANRVAGLLQSSIVGDTEYQRFEGWDRVKAKERKKIHKLIVPCKLEGREGNESVPRSQSIPVVVTRVDIQLLIIKYWSHLKNQWK